MRLYGRPYFARVRLDKLTAFVVDETFNRMESDGVSAWNRKMTAMVMSYALDYAVRPLKLIAFNPCHGIAKAVPDEKDIRVLSPDEVKKLLEMAKGNRLEALFVLALASGMRQGELLGLYWDDIDCAAGTVSVRRSLANLKDSGFTLKQPKTKRSRRTLDLPAFALDALHEHRKKMLAEGKPVQGEARVFCTRTANWIAKSNLIRYTFKPLLAKAGLPPIRFHDLRHTHASNLLQKRMPVEDVSARLGHANVTTTYKVYSHLIPKSGNDAAKMLQDLFG